MSQIPDSFNSQRHETEEKKELNPADRPEDHPVMPPLPKLRRAEDIISLGTSIAYPEEERAHEEMLHILPIQTAGLLGLGQVDLSSLKRAKLQVNAATIPESIIEKMVYSLARNLETRRTLCNSCRGTWY